MATFASSAWIPEDDLLLKNAVEAGASLEALAKGAVQFSRKFSIRELQDRWYSLLYDPDISAEASACMVKFEHSSSYHPSKVNKFANPKESAEIPAKRKVETVRRLYYALRKRTCKRSCDPTNLSFLATPSVNDFATTGMDSQENVGILNDPPIGSCDLGNCIQDQSFGEIGANIHHHGPQDDNSKGIVRNDYFNVPNTVRSSSVKESVKDECFKRNNANEEPTHVLGETLHDFRSHSGVENEGPTHALPDSSSPFPSMGCSSPQPGMPLWKAIEDISVPAMPINLLQGDKGLVAEQTIILSNDTDSKKVSSSVMLKDEHVGDETAMSECDLMDISDSLLNFENEEELLFLEADGKDKIDKSSDDVQEDVGDARIPQTLVFPRCEAICNDACPAKLDVIDDHQPHHADSNQHHISNSEVSLKSLTSVPNPFLHTLHDEEMECTLNGEDPEIPCNDDILSGKAFVSSFKQRNSKEISPLASSFPGHTNSIEELSLTEVHPAKSITNLWMVRPDMLPGTNTNLPFVCRVKSACSDSQCHEAEVCWADQRQCNSVHFQDSAMDIVLAPSCCATDELVPAKEASILNTILKPEANHLTNDQEDYESDGNVPCFSDIEAMILEMDLCPEDSDSCISREASRYQYEDGKRTIIRLEQGARSSIRRAIASQGALAILYGRNLKYYIKKAEVLLGRATDEIDVDIDLGREGHANKISRRQALIKLEGDGSFSIKNLGKSLIYVNGKEITLGQLTRLGSNSLIEIREMSFVFEMNDKSLRRCLMNVSNKNQERNNNFDWQEEEVP